MVTGKSPEWLPSGFTEKVKYKNGRKIKYYCNVATGAKYYSKKDVLLNATSDNGILVTPQMKNSDIDRNGFSSDNTIIAKTNVSPEWLPNGWTMEEKTRQSGSRMGTTYKVYTELSSGSKFYSRASVTRYLNTLNHVDTPTVQKEPANVDEPSRGMPLQQKSMTNQLGNVDGPSPDPSKQQKSMKNQLDNVDEASTDMSLQQNSMSNTDSIPKKKQKSSKFETVATETMAAEDLPPGWIKEIKTSKSGNKIRKDPYYTDPVSGYVFRSKLDALRYLKTNDISSCACRPMIRELDDLKLIKNDIPPSNAATGKLSEHKRQLFVSENNGGTDSSGTKALAETEVKIAKEPQDNNGYNSSENSKKNAKKKTGPKPENKQVSKKIQENPQADLRKSKKRKSLSLPSRASKRLAGSEPEVLPSNSVLNERALRAAARRNSDGEIEIPPGFSPKASASIPIGLPPISVSASIPIGLSPISVSIEHALRDAAKRTSDDERDAAKGASDDERDIPPGFSPKASATIPIEFAKAAPLQQIGPPKEVENPPEKEQPAIPEDPTSEKASENGKRPQESQLCYDFGDSWSDPLEFALKTLRGEISIDDNLAFPGSFDEQVNIPYNLNFPPNSEPPKPHGGAVDPLFDMNFPSCSGFNIQSSAEAGKKDGQTKFNP